MKYRKLISGLLLCMIMAAACKKTEQEDPVRLFRPVLTRALVADSNAIQATFTDISAAESYVLQLSRDTFKTIDLTLTVDTNVVSIENLRWDQLYQLQVRSIASDTMYNSRWSYLGGVKTPKFPSILKSPTISDLTEEAIRVSWTNLGATVTSIKVLKTDSSLVREVPLTATDVANQFRVIGGLSANTSYIVMLYSGAALRGYDLFTTKAPLAGTIVDLRSVEGRPSVLQDTIPFVEAGTTILLKRGVTYTITGGTPISKAVTIMSGADLSVTTRAEILFSSNFNFTEGSTIDYIDFNDVVLRGDNFASRYVFNTTAGANVGRISLRNSLIEIFRGIVRLQSGNTTVSDFVVDNCIIDSIAGYGVITVDNVTCKAENISITNTTIYKAEKVVTSRQNSNSVLIENCTVNEAPRAGNYLVDYSTSGTNNVTSGITITNCIFGSPKNFEVGVRGIRAGTSTSVIATNNYATSDYSLAATTPLPIPNLIMYTKPSTQVWESPLTGNFRIIDPAFPGRNTAGDPRWR